MLHSTISKATRRPRFRRTDTPPAFQLTERDIEIVRQVARHRFLRSTHLSQLLDAPHKKIIERLSPLFHAGYLDRPRAQLEYHVYSGRRNLPIVYALGSRGAQLLAEHDGLSTDNADWVRKNREASRQFLLHTLAIADVHTALMVACRARQAVRLQEADELLSTVPEHVHDEPNPWSWRVRVHHNGTFAETAVLPDYVFALAFSDGTRRAYLAECDRGTMPIERASLTQTSMLRKFLAYEAGRQQKLHTSRFGWKNFRVLIVTATAERADNMRALIERTPQLKGSPLFLFTDHTALTQANILTHLWLDPSGKTHTLIEGVNL